MERRKGQTPAMPATSAAAYARAWTLQNDPEIKSLRARIKKIDLKMRMLERRFPMDIDVESVEMYLANHLDETGHELVRGFIDRYRVLAEYANLAVLRALLERLVDARIRAIAPSVREADIAH